MKDVLKIMLNGAYTNFKRILFAADRVTDMELRNAILTGTVEPDKKVDEEACIGCGGCAKEGWVKTEVPELDPLKCVVCYWCHDFCPIYSFFEEAGTIHPGNVGEINVDTSELLEEPIKISHDKIAFIAQYLSDRSLLSENIVQEDEKIENVGVALDKVSKIKDIQDNINEKYEKDVQRSSEFNEEDSDDEGGE